MSSAVGNVRGAVGSEEGRSVCERGLREEEKGRDGTTMKGSATSVLGGLEKRRKEVVQEAGKLERLGEGCRIRGVRTRNL